MRNVGILPLGEDRQPTPAKQSNRLHPSTHPTHPLHPPPSYLALGYWAFMVQIGKLEEHRIKKGSHSSYTDDERGSALGSNCLRQYAEIAPSQ